MINRKDLAIELWKKGLNCSQAVLVAHKDLVNVDEKVLFSISEGFGSGISGMKKTCGALTAAIMLLGLVNSTGDLNNPTSKGKTYEIGNTLLKDFENKHSSIECEDLKGIKSGKVLLPCAKCITEACELIEKYIIK